MLTWQQGRCWRGRTADVAVATSTLCWRGDRVVSLLTWHLGGRCTFWNIDMPTRAAYSLSPSSSSFCQLDGSTAAPFLSLPLPPTFVQLNPVLSTASNLLSKNNVKKSHSSGTFTCFFVFCKHKLKPKPLCSSSSPFQLLPSVSPPLLRRHRAVTDSYAAAAPTLRCLQSSPWILPSIF